MRRGTLGRYYWGEFLNERPELNVRAVLAGLLPFLLGLRGVNSSWDSGLLRPSDPDRPADWTYESEYAVSPPITKALAVNWPQSDEGFDEWYFFRTVPALFNLNAFCNYAGESLADAGQLAFPGGLFLEEQLERWSPDVVVGQGYSIFVIAADDGVVTTFGDLAREP